MKYEVIPIRPGFWAIQDGNVRMYLLDGGTDAVLIDTGYGSGDLKKLVKSLVAGKIHVINTHCHNDHTSGNRQFDHFLMSSEDAGEILCQCPPGAGIDRVKDGDILRFGSINLEVLAIPGHTPGAIALLDREHRLLFSGDSFAKLYPIYMQYPGQDLNRYLQSLRRMQLLEDAYDRVCPAHGELEIEKSYIQKTINCCCGIMTHTLKAGLATLADGNSGRAYWYEDVAIFY